MAATQLTTGNKIGTVRNLDLSSLVQSWYPLLRSADVRVGKAVAIEVLGHSLVVFRNKASELGVIKRECCHMGGDLSGGCVTEVGIQCPIHAWEFSVTGTRVLRDGRTDAKFSQASLHCIERHGIVFAFFGPQVLFDVPEPSEPVFQSPVIVRDFDAHYDVPTIFGFDTEHFATVHHRDLESMEIYSTSKHHLGTRLRSKVVGDNPGDRIMRLVGLSEVDIDIGYWGANIMLGHHKRSNTYVLLTTLPLGENRLRMFVSMQQRRPDAGALRQLLSWLRFKISQPVIGAFVAQDERALCGVRFDPQRADISNNEGVRRWLEHYQSLPRISAARVFHAD